MAPKQESKDPNHYAVEQLESFQTNPVVLLVVTYPDDVKERDATKFDHHGTRFPDYLHFIGERVRVGKSDAMNFAKAYTPRPEDSANWPSGVTCVRCFRCNSKPDNGHMAVQKHVRFVKSGAKTLTCRMMPKLVCDECYLYYRGRFTALPESKVQRSRCYYQRWTDLPGLVGRLSDAFVKEMRAAVFKNKKVKSTVTENGQQKLTFAPSGAPDPASPSAAAPAPAVPAPNPANTSSAPQTATVAVGAALASALASASSQSSSSSAAAGSAAQMAFAQQPPPAQTSPANSSATVAQPAPVGQAASVSEPD